MVRIYTNNPATLDKSNILTLGAINSTIASSDSIRFNLNLRKVRLYIITLLIQVYFQLISSDYRPAALPYS